MEHKSRGWGRKAPRHYSSLWRATASRSEAAVAAPRERAPFRGFCTGSGIEVRRDLIEGIQTVEISPR